MARIGVVQSGFYSHVEAIKRVSRALERQGHVMIPLEPSEEMDVPVGTPAHNHHPALERISQSAPIEAGLAELAERYSEELIEALLANDLDLVIHDVMASWGRVAADFCGIPRIVSCPLFPRRVRGGHRLEVPGQAAAGSTADFYAKGQRVDEARRVEVSRLAIARRWKVELGGHWDIMFSAGDTILGLSTPRLIGERIRGPWHFVGPLLDSPRPANPEVEERPLVYVCLGTSFNLRVEPFRAAIEGLADENVDVLVSLGGGKLAAADLGPLPPNVCVRDFALSREVLAGATVHVTHSGSNSVHESLLAGVPMILLPQGADQFALAGRIERLGAGRIAAPAPASIRAGVRWLLDQRRPRIRARRLGRHLANFDGEARLAKVVERKLAASGAGHRRSRSSARFSRIPSTYRALPSRRGKR